MNYDRDAWKQLADLYERTERNVATMRELALALWAACDFVERSNPGWASHVCELDPPESFEVGS